MANFEDDCVGTWRPWRHDVAHYRHQDVGPTIVPADVTHCAAWTLDRPLMPADLKARVEAQDPDGSFDRRSAVYALICNLLRLHRRIARDVARAADLTAIQGAYRVFLRRQPKLCRARNGPNALPPAVIADLRTDHAGEFGAVQIYRGILTGANDRKLRALACAHLFTERQHLQQVSLWLPKTERSLLLPLWRVAGWLTGLLPALLGPPAVYVTVSAVERFVDQHYAAQIERLSKHAELKCPAGNACCMSPRRDRTSRRCTFAFA